MIKIGKGVPVDDLHITEHGYSTVTFFKDLAF